MKTATVLFASIFLISLTNCKPGPAGTVEAKAITADSGSVKEEPYKAYFDFDEIVHYSTDIPHYKVFVADSVEDKTKEQKRKLDLLKNYHDSVLDTVVAANLESLNFKRSAVPFNKFAAISEIFSERKDDSTGIVSCIPIFRDILIFKKCNKTIGLAKICFSCGQNVIMGTECDVSTFGQAQGYSKLHTILYGPNKKVMH
ncbi:MAG TPA: hypothetical protein VGC65_04390 [Bacteroidia bacterium]|jgi:hypothetical protein